MTDANEGLPFSLPEAEAHLRRTDPVLAPLIDRFGPYTPRRGSDPYGSLLRAILFQQLAGAAALAIQKRFLSLYGDDGRFPEPPRLLATADEELRAAGISRQKAAYMKDLAHHVSTGLLDFVDMDALSDDEVIGRLTAVKGIGEWTAHMFLMFQLGRPDVLPVGDLGVRSGMRLAYGLPEAPTPARAREIGAPWAPFRSVGSWYMWRVVEVKLPVSPQPPGGG
jgi:DNA-3-methyladenine glycosylase II